MMRQEKDECSNESLCILFLVNNTIDFKKKRSKERKNNKKKEV